MASKPTKLGEWASDAGRTVEPSAGEKGTGWQGGYKPPAHKMNWLFNVAYQWFQYLSDAIFVANSGSGKDGLKATGDGTGAGVDGTGGATNAIGVQGTATGTGEGVRGLAAGATPTAATASGVYGVAGAVSAAGVRGDGKSGGSGVDQGVGVRGYGKTDGAGVYGAGGSSNGPGVYGVGGTSNGTGVYGKGTGTGAGVHAYSLGGTPLRITGDQTAPVARAACRIEPQPGQPSSFNPGDFYSHGDSDSTKLRHYNGNEWERLVPQVHSIIADDGPTATGGGTVDFTTSEYVIPANTLKQYGTIRVKVIGRVTAHTNGDVGLKLDDGTSTLITKAPVGGNSYFALEGTYTVRTNPSGAATVYGAATIISNANMRIAVTASSSLATNGDIDLRVTADGTQTVQVLQFTVDIT